MSPLLVLMPMVNQGYLELATGSTAGGLYGLSAASLTAAVTVAPVRPAAPARRPGQGTPPRWPRDDPRGWRGGALPAAYVAAGRDRPGRWRDPL
jgi:hypothetical protein